MTSAHSSFWFRTSARFLLSPLGKRLARIVVRFIIAPAISLRTRFFPRKAVLYAGQMYYNTWYLSRALRAHGWTADVLNWDLDPAAQMHYHGEDYRYDAGDPVGHLLFYFAAILRYDVFHFSNARGMTFGGPLTSWLGNYFWNEAEVDLLQRCGKKIVYSNNACQDGALQSSFAKWGPESVCDSCSWRHRPDVCSDQRSREWGEFRNLHADYQCTLGGNRVDYNDDPRVHEVPEFYCLDSSIWRPDLSIPEKYLYAHPPGTIRLYHAVGNFDLRTDSGGKNVKSTHIYAPLVRQLKAEGYPVEMVFCSNVPNIEVRFYQAQADIFLEMLTYGWFGANAREAMMLGKPVICFLRPEWLATMRREIPDYVDELPVVNATAANVREVLVDLITDTEKRRRIGAQSRAFALKWHSGKAAGKRFDALYSRLLGLDVRIG